MKFTLKDYQSEAVKDVLINLKKARKRWHEDSDKHAFSLTATTGAGKTVMAAAVFDSERVLAAGAAGTRKVGSGVPLAVHDKLPVASIAKTMTATPKIARQETRGRA